MAGVPWIESAARSRQGEFAVRSGRQWVSRRRFLAVAAASWSRLPREITSCASRPAAAAAMVLEDELLAILQGAHRGIDERAAIELLPWKRNFLVAPE